MTKNNSIKILTILNIASKFLSIVYIPIITNLLTNYGYGVYGATYSIYTFVYIITISGISTAIPKFIAEYNFKNEKINILKTFYTGNLILIIYSFINCSIFVLLSSWLAKYIGFPNAKIAIIMIAPSIVFTALISSYRGYFQGVNKFHILGISQIIEQIANVFFSIMFVFILSHYNIYLAVAGGALGTTVASFICYIYLKIAYRTVFKNFKFEKTYIDKKIVKAILKYSIPIIVSAIFIYGGNNILDIHYITLGLRKAGLNSYMRGSLYGGYTQFIQLVNIPMILISTMSIAIVPIISKANVDKNKDIVRENILQVFKICFLLSIPAVFMLSIFSKEIFLILKIPSNSIGSELLMYGAIIFIVTSAYQVSNTVMNSLGFIKINMMNSLIGIIIKIILDIILIPITFINIYGVVISLFISNFIGALFNIYFINKKASGKIFEFSNIYIPLLASVIMAIILIILKFIFIKIFTLFVGIYIAMILGVILSTVFSSIVFLNIIIRFKEYKQIIKLIIPNRIYNLIIIKK